MSVSFEAAVTCTSTDSLLPRLTWDVYGACLLISASDLFFAMLLACISFMLLWYDVCGMTFELPAFVALSFVGDRAFVDRGSVDGTYFGACLNSGSALLVNGFSFYFGLGFFFFLASSSLEELLLELEESLRFLLFFCFLSLFFAAWILLLSGLFLLLGCFRFTFLSSSVTNELCEDADDSLSL